MTRWARTKSAHRHEKVPGDATPWSKLKRTPEVRSFKDGRKGSKPNGVEGNQGGGGGGLKRNMPGFKGTNFARQLPVSEECIKKPFAVADPAYGGGQGDPSRQNSKSQSRNKFQKKIHGNPLNNAIKVEPKEYGVSNVQDGPKQKNSKSENRKKFQKTIKREVSFTPREESNKPIGLINSIKVEPREMGDSQQDLSSKNKRKRMRKKLKKGELTSENHGIHTAEGNTTEKYFKEEKLPHKSLLLVKQEPTDFSMQSRKRAKKRKRDSSQTKNVDTPNVVNVVGLQSNKTELGTDTPPNKKKRNRKKKRKLSLQDTNTTDLSKTSDSSEKPNKTEVSTNTNLNKKRNKLTRKKSKLAALSTDANDSDKAAGSEVRGQETDDQKRIDKEQKKTMHRLKQLAQREKKGITMLSDKAERKLYLIRKALKKRGKSPEEIKSILRKERRVAELKFRKAQKTVCFRCRLQGHTVATCTTILEDDEQSMGVCFRCGSTEHILRHCQVSKTEGQLPFAKCFICESRGHLSSACPKNKLGVYPRGGACLLCKSVNHLKKDCPTLVKDEEEEPFVAYRTTEFGSVDAEVSEEAHVSKKKKAKVVTF